MENEITSELSGKADNNILNHTVDILIIGAGFTGLSLAIHLEEKSIGSYLILEVQDKVGGKLQCYQQKYIYDLPGILKITAEQLIKHLESQIIHKEKIKLLCSMERIEKIPGGKIIHYYDHQLKSRGRIFCKKLILTCGKGEIKPIKITNPSLMELEKEDRIFYFLNNRKEKYEKKVVAVFGGGDSAIDACTYLSPLCEKVYLIHRRIQYTAMPGKIIAMEKLSNLQELKNHNLLEAQLTFGSENSEIGENHLPSSEKGFVTEDNLYNLETPKNNQSLKKLDKNMIKLTLLNNETRENQDIFVDLIGVFYGLVEDDAVIKTCTSTKKIPVNKENTRTINNELVDFALGDISIYEDKRFLLHNYLAEVEKLVYYLCNGN